MSAFQIDEPRGGLHGRGPERRPGIRGPGAIIAQLSGFNRYPWIATAYLLTSTVSVPIFASLSDIHGRKPFFLLGAIVLSLRF